MRGRRSPFAAREPMHVAYVADENFALPVTVALTSLFENCLHPVHAYLLDAGMQAGTRARVESALRRWLHRHELTWIPLPMSRLENLGHGILPNTAPWGRLLLPELLPAALSRVLYLDADTVVLRDLAEIYFRPFNDFCLLGVQDRNGWLGSKMMQIHNLERFGVAPDAPCMNSGVLLFDLSRWREEKLLEKVIAFAETHPDTLHLADQNPLNLALRGKIGYLPQRWNVQPVNRRIRSGEWNDIPTLPAPPEPPGIYHFLSDEKPWLPGCAVPERALFHRFWRSSGWPVPEALRTEVNA